MTSGIVYHVFNKTNGKCYVGQTWFSLQHRWNKHLYSSRNGSRLKFHAAIRKYEFDVWVCSVLTSLLCSQSELDECERYWISYFDCSLNGYNIEKGGNHCRHSEETKKKISDAHKGKKFSQEHRTKLSKSKSGKHLSKQHRERISLAKLGKKRPVEVCTKIALAKSMQVVCVQDDLKYQSLKIAAANYGIPYSSARHSLITGKVLPKYGLSFKEM